MDFLSAKQRSLLMSKVLSENTTAELLVRKAAHALGLRYRLHRRDLPGTPDLVFPQYRVALFVHGCFWHRHPGCNKATTPKSHVRFWLEKFERNVERDKRVNSALRRLGWHPKIIWECETKKPEVLAKLLRKIFQQRQSMRKPHN